MISKNYTIEQFEEWDDEDTDHGLSDYDFEGDDYDCTRCNGAGCTKCEE